MLKAFLCSFLVLCGQGLFAKVPNDWEQMEVEAKWVTTEKGLAQVKDFFVDGTSIYGYTANVRWGGRSRKFMDIYYDNNVEALKNKGHALRHRSVYGRDNFLWSKVQYKSTAVREGAVWFRTERGSCFTSHRSHRNLCFSTNTDGDQLIQQGEALYSSHAAIALLLSEHSGFYSHGPLPVLEIDDDRYRVELLDDNGEVIFELSFDTYEKRDLVTGNVSKHYELELEILDPHPNQQTLVRLFSMVEKLEADFDLTPSSYTKSGVFVSE